MLPLDSRRNAIILSALLSPACATVASLPSNAPGVGLFPADFAIESGALAALPDPPVAGLDDRSILSRRARASRSGVQEHASQAGDWRLFGLLPLYSDYSSDVDAVLGDADAVELELDFEGKFGLALGVEYMLHRDVAVRVALDYRVLEPSNPRNADGSLSEFFVFDDVDYLEYALALRWWPASLAFGPNQRVRPFVDAKIGYVPSIKADTQVRFGSEFLEDQAFTFEGDAYFNAGVSTGLTYEWSRALHFSAGVLYEEPLDSTSDDTVLYPVPDLPTLDLPMSYTLEPIGWLFFVGLTWGF